GLTMALGNNIGYFGPYEHKLRNIAEVPHWKGCTAGQTAIALEADGTVKGCPSLPTVGYAGGNIRELSLEEIWNTSPEIHFGRLRSVDDLWGFCRTCYYADVCRGGCTWTSHSLLGKPGNNPYCHYRALELNKQGLRERIRKVEDAAQSSFAVGRFEVIRESVPENQTDAVINWQGMPQQTDVQIPVNFPEAEVYDQNPEGRVPPELERCKACNQFILPDEEVCPACETNVAEANTQYAEDKQRWEALMAKIQAVISR
ncbi:MAG: SPASM domain-containing protein, partial [Spirulina sp. SIO3F2]|nr:SPASM domain-containing protein [Spirulina sp. SIO3F2]